jgi:predicted O-linked N-acetylglucosamine transferase (SPINDLY family)
MFNLPQPSAPGASPPASRAARAYQRWLNGRQLADRGDWRHAAEHFKQAFDLHDAQPDYGLAWAQALLQSGQPALAQKAAATVRQRLPLYTAACVWEARALWALGLNPQALQVLQTLPAQAPRDHDYFAALGLALQRCGQAEWSIGVFLQSLMLKMDAAEVHYRLAHSFKDLGRKAEAAECIRTALALGLGEGSDTDLAARTLLWFFEREACRWPQAEQARLELEALIKALPDGAPARLGPFEQAVLHADAALQRKVACHYAADVARRVKPLPPVKAHPGRGRLRVAYLSSDFHQHATSILAAQMLESHDRQRYEVRLISAGPDDHSPMRERIKQAAEHFDDVHGWSHARMAQHIRQCGIDILVDMKGVTFGTLLPVMAHRPAPIQVSWLGFPGTSGAPFIDYIVGDPVVTPVAHAAQFTEKIAQLPHCYQPNDAHRVRPDFTERMEWGLPPQAVVLCAFHQSYKITQPVFDSWCRILRAQPNTVLWLLRWNENVQAQLVQAAQARGVAAERLVFAPFITAEENLSRMASADVFLDAWPCNAHTTASEALWAGVPMVTLEGEPFAQRVASSLLQAAGLGQWVTHLISTYEDRVQQLMQDPVLRADIRQHLWRHRQSGPLFEGAAFTRSMQGLYERMWARALAGLAPEHLLAQQG